MINITKLEQHFYNAKNEIGEWFDCQWEKTKPLFYCSSDLRISGFKIAPVDTNAFPAGFNNLDANKICSYACAAKRTLGKINSQIKKILIIPEDHTRNMFYFENLFCLQQILQHAGFETRFGSLMLPCCSTQKSFALPSGNMLELHSFHRRDYTLTCKDFSPDAILLNNDLSDCIPEVLHNLQQPIFPSLNYAWVERSKSAHFAVYQKIAHSFARKFNFDPWLITPIFNSCSDVEFLHRHGEECLMEHIEDILKQMRVKYREYKIEDKPFVVVKTDAGTYGMAVMTIDEPEKIRHLNRRVRSHMAKTKGGREVTRVIVQEGIPTTEYWGEEKIPAEPVMYVIGENTVGGFLRINSKRNNTQNLNSRGMEFRPLKTDYQRNYLYSVVAELAALAAGREGLRENQ